MGGLIIFALLVYVLAKRRSAKRISRSIDRVSRELAWRREHGEYL